MISVLIILLLLQGGGDGDGDGGLNSSLVCCGWMERRLKTEETVVY